MNSRIKKIGDLHEVRAEAIASTITFHYDPVHPEDTSITFAYRDYLTDTNGRAQEFACGDFIIINLKLAEVLDWNLNGLTPVQVVEAIRVATDIAHNKKYGER